MHHKLKLCFCVCRADLLDVAVSSGHNPVLVDQRSSTEVEAVGLLRKANRTKLKDENEDEDEVFVVFVEVR